MSMPVFLRGWHLSHKSEIAVNSKHCITAKCFQRICVPEFLLLIRMAILTDVVVKLEELYICFQGYQ